MKVGVVALQGAVTEHLEAFTRCGAEAVAVRNPEDLAGVEAAVLPGGESTAIGMLLQRNGLGEALKERVGAGMALWGTCAGMILMADTVLDGVAGQFGLELMELEVRRNAYGRQVESFETALSIPELGEEPFTAVFIRAPVAEKAGPQVQVLARYGDLIVAARQGRMLVTAFHPELNGGDRFHQFFLEMAAEGRRGQAT